MWVVLCALHFYGAEEYTYTNEQTFEDLGRAFISSWPYGGNTSVSHEFLPKVGDTLPVCDTEECGPITFDLSSISECEEEIFHPETKNRYVLNKAASNYVLTAGTQQARERRVEVNGNILDVVNASMYFFASQHNFENNRFRNFTGLQYQKENLFNNFKSKTNFNNITFNVPGLGELYPSCDERSRWFNSLPFWASDKAAIPMCMYTLSMTKYNKNVNQPENPVDIGDFMTMDTTFNKQKSNHKQAKTCASPDFSELNSANFDVFCKEPPGRTVVLPGRCSMFDTNYLFRRQSKERVFQWAQNSKGKWAVIVYGRSQCDPMYGGKLVDFNDDSKEVFPKGTDTLSSDYFFDGFDVDNYNDIPSTDLPVRSSNQITDECGTLRRNIIGTKLTLPLESFATWKIAGKPNPNPAWFFRSRPDWEDGNPAGLLDFTADSEFACQKFSGPFPGIINVNTDILAVHKALKRRALKVSSRSFRWASQGNDLTHDNVNILHGLLDKQSTSQIRKTETTEQNDFQKTMKFIQNFKINKLLLPELASGRVLLSELTPSHGVPGLTNDAIENSRAELLEVVSALMLLVYKPESIDSFIINQRIGHERKTLNATHKNQTNESLWFGTHGQSLAAQVGPKILFDPTLHRRSTEQLKQGTENEYPHILPDSWSFYVGHKHEGTQTNWNTGYGVPSLIFNPGTLTITPILGEPPKPLNNTNKSDSKWGNAQLHNIFACELFDSEEVQFVKQETSKCMDIYQNTSVDAINLPIMPHFPNEDRQFYCRGFMTLLGPVYSAKRTCSDLVNQSTPGMPFWDTVKAAKCVTDHAESYFTGGTNPASQSCHVDTSRNRYAAHAIVPVGTQGKQDPCTYSSDEILKTESEIMSDLGIAATPLPHDCGRFKHLLMVALKNPQVRSDYLKLQKSNQETKLVELVYTYIQLKYPDLWNSFTKSNTKRDYELHGYSASFPCLANDIHTPTFKIASPVNRGNNERFCLATVRKYNQHTQKAYTGGFREMSVQVTTTNQLKQLAFSIDLTEEIIQGSGNYQQESNKLVAGFRINDKDDIVDDIFKGKFEANNNDFVPNIAAEVLEPSTTQVIDQFESFSRRRNRKRRNWFTSVKAGFDSVGNFFSDTAGKAINFVSDTATTVKNSVDSLPENVVKLFGDPKFVFSRNLKRKPMASSQFSIQYNKVNEKILYEWFPEQISLANNQDVVTKSANQNRESTSDFDGPEGFLPNVVASETRSGLVLGAWELLKIVYNLDTKHSPTWKNILPQLDKCVKTANPHQGSTNLPRTAEEWEKAFSELKGALFHHSCFEIPNMYNCTEKKQDHDCKHFAPYNKDEEEKSSEGVDTFFYTENNKTEFFKNHACPVQAGCMLKPIGDVHVTTESDTDDMLSRKSSILMQSTSDSLYCAPAFWETALYPPGSRTKEEEPIYLYQPDPGANLAMRKQTFQVSINAVNPVFDNPGTLWEVNQSQITNVPGPYYFTDGHAVFYRIEFNQSQFKSYISGEFADVNNIDCPDYVSRINWDSTIQINKTSVPYFGPEVFKVEFIDVSYFDKVQYQTASAGRGPFFDKFLDALLTLVPPVNFRKLEFDPDLTANSNQKWLKITGASHPGLNISSLLNFTLTFECFCNDCDPVPFFEASKVPEEFANGHAFSKNCNGGECLVPTGATFADPRFNWRPAFSVNPYAILPPLVFKPKYVPQYQTAVRSQHKAVSAISSEGSCVCGGPNSIKFFCEATPLQFEDSAIIQGDDKVAQNTKDGVIAALTQNRIKAQTEYISCGYSWTDFDSIHAPSIGLFLGSTRKDYKVVERNILLDAWGMSNTHYRDHLQGLTGGKPDFSHEPMRDRYWFSGNKKPFNYDQDETFRLYNASIKPVMNYTLLPNKNTTLKKQANPSSYVCAFKECLDALSKGQKSHKLCNSKGYQIEQFHNSLAVDATVLCWRRWYYEYQFESSCTKWPYGFVQSFEMHEDDRHTLFPPPEEPVDYLMSYCDTFMNKAKTDERFMFCNKDPFGDNEARRKSFCSSTQNPLGVQHRLDGLIITDHPIEAACSDTLKACLIIPGSQGASSFGTVLNTAEPGKYINYTMLRTNFNFLAVVNMFGFMTKQTKSNLNKSVTDDESVAYTGFRQSQNVFNMFLNLDNVPDIDTVKTLCSNFEDNLRDATQGDGQFCPKGKVQLLAVSNSEYAYRCEDEDWWKADPLTEREILVRDDGVTLDRACNGCGPLTFETLSTERPHDTCTRIEVGGARFQLPNVIFNQSLCKLSRVGTDNRMTPIIFSGKDISGAYVNMSHVHPTSMNDYASVLVLGDDTAFFGHHPTIYVNDTEFIIDGTVQYAIGAARAEGTINLDCGAGNTCDIIIQQPNQTFKPVLFESDNALRVYDIGNYTNVFGTSIERNLFSRNVDFSTTGWIFVAVLSILFLLQVTIIIITMIDPSMIEGMVTEALYGRILPYRGPHSRIFFYDPEKPVTLTKTGPESYVWNSHYSNQVDKTGTPKTGALVVETQFVISERTNDRHTFSTFYHLAYDLRVECIKRDGAIPVPNTLIGHSPGLRTVPKDLYDTLLNI